MTAFPVVISLKLALTKRLTIKIEYTRKGCTCVYALTDIKMVTGSDTVEMYVQSYKEKYRIYGSFPTERGRLLLEKAVRNLGSGPLAFVSIDL